LNLQKRDRAREATDDSIIRRTCNGYRIPKATNIHSQYTTLIAFPRQQWLCERASILRSSLVRR